MMDRPAIKPLEWRIEGESRHGPWLWEASSIIKGYTIRHMPSDLYKLDGHGEFPSLEAAKAAAQQDYESLIRSCLIDKPEAGESVTEKMRVAACRVLTERGKGNNVTIPDVVAMLDAALSAGSEIPKRAKRIDVDGACIRCGGVECMPEGGLTCTICIDAILNRSELNGADRRPFAADLSPLSAGKPEAGEAKRTDEEIDTAFWCWFENGYPSSTTKFTKFNMRAAYIAGYEDAESRIDKPEAGEAIYRFLVEGDTFEATDEAVHDNGVDWEPVMREVVGGKYLPGIFKTVRRRVSPLSAGDAGERHCADIDWKSITAKIAHHVTRMNRECVTANEQGNAIAADCEPLFESLGMSFDADGWGYDTEDQ